MNNYDELREEYKRRMNSGDKNVFLFPVVAIIFIVIGVFILNRTDEFMKSANITTAKVYTERNTYEVNEDHPNYYRSYAEYYVNGVRYYEPINTSKTKFSLGPFSYTKTRNGEEIVIYYNPDNPSEIMEKSTNIFGYFFIGFGVLIIIVLIGRLIHKILVNDDVFSSKSSDENIQNKVLEFFDDKKLNKIENVQNVINISLNNVFKIIAIIIGILIILFGILSLNIDFSFSKNYKETTAIVVKISQTEESDSNNKRYMKTHVYVKYKIDSKEYNGEVDKSSSYKINDKITVYYNPDNPYEIRTSKEMNFSGIVIIIVGFSIIMVGIIKKTNRKRDRREGDFNKIDFFN